MAANIYDQHKAAFANVAAYVVLKDGERVATVAFKFGNAVTAYVHWIGVQMTKGVAKGGGYDRMSASVAMAADKIADRERETENQAVARIGFIAAARKDGGATWIRSLEDAGFVVVLAV
jgi:hypothetical protein